MPLLYIRIGNATLMDPQDKANEFAKKFYEQFSPNLSTDFAKELRINLTVQIYKIVQFIDLGIPVIGLAGSLDVKKASGLNGLPNAALRHAPDNTLSAMTNIANVGHFPSDWKGAKLTLIRKRSKKVTNINS